MAKNARARFDNAKRRRPEMHDRQRQLTPAYLLEPCRQLLGGFDLDPCTEPDNPTGARLWCTPPADGAVVGWPRPVPRTRVRIWCNPPYGEARARWTRRCVDEAQWGSEILLLIPAHTETVSTQEALHWCTSALFICARLRFELVRSNGRHEAASHPSVLFGFNVDLTPLETEYSIGQVLIRHK